ncbi:MAG: hypothetical protein ACRC3Y_11555 [Romboutsia sp.]|uniref:hypothetical protein n=1 Tax=Romboutsia sp. TaxID=1965302 RepID=UPI003F3BA5C8
MRKLILTLSFMILFSSVSFAYPKEIIVENNVELTQKLGYPVLTVTNTSDKEISVEYDYHKYPNKTTVEDIVSSVTLKGNETKEIHLKELAFLANTNQSRRVWFNWHIDNFLKPKNTDIDTIPFTSSSTNQEELG